MNAIKLLVTTLFVCVMVINMNAQSQFVGTDASPDYKKFRKNCTIDKIEYTENRTIVHFQYKSTGKYSSVWLHPNGGTYPWQLEADGEVFELIEIRNVRQNGKLKTAVVEESFSTYSSDRKMKITCEIHFERLPNSIKEVDLIEGVGQHDNPFHFNCLNIQLQTIDEPVTVVDEPVAEEIVEETTEVVANHTSDLETLEATNWRAFPNPATDFINIDRDEVGAANIEILNIAGQVVFQEEIQDQTHTLDVSKYAAGTYIIKMTQNAQTTATKVIIK